MTEWSSVVVIVTPDEVDQVSGLVWELGVSGIEEQPLGEASIELRIGCVADLTDVVLETLSKQWDPRAETVSADAGLDAWREHAQIWHIGATTVVPPWREVPTDLHEEQLVLVIDPGHAFGSASHETTRLCLEVAYERVAPEMTVADIGCGSGVLAIAAARRGAARVVATDISPEAIIATIENARRNGVSEVIEVSTAAPDELTRSSFDVVFANIGAATLTSIAADLIGLLSATGVVVLSGVLDSQIDHVVADFERSGAVHVETRAEGEWRTAVLRRAGA